MLYRNDIFRILGVRYRLLAIFPDRDDAYVITQDEKTGLPYRRHWSNLLNDEEKGNLLIEAAPTLISAHRASKAALDIRDAIWFRIEPLVTSTDIFLAERRGPMVAGRALELNCSIQTLYDNLRRYWRNGQTKDSLIPEIHHRGTSPQSITAGRGRKPKRHDGGIFQMDENAKKKAIESIEKYYLIGEVTTLEKAYERHLRDHYSYTDGNGKGYHLSDGQCPSSRQFRHICKSIGLEKIIRRHGDKLFEQNSRPKLGSAQDDCQGVGHIYEIDATIADVFLVATKDRSRIIGKPTLYLIYDRRSRLVVGFYIGLEPPSWPAAMQAILSIAEDKAALCQRYGVEYDARDWPAHGVYPQMFMADRGEMASKNSSLLVAGLGIRVANAASMRPDYKGTVECGFKLLQRSMSDTLKGYEPPENVTKRRGKNYSQDACLTIDEFIRVMLANIVAHNRQVMPGYPLSAELLSQDFKPIPRNLWAHEVRLRVGVLTRHTVDAIRFALLPRSVATVTQKGIEFKGCFYTCPEAIAGGWFVKAGQRTFKIDIAYDRRLVDRFFIFDPHDPSHHYVATLLEKIHDYQGLSFAEVEAYEEMRKQMQYDAASHNRQQRLDFHDATDATILSASLETKAITKGKSRRSRRKDTAEDRLEEQRERRQHEAKIPLQRDTAPVQADNNVVPLTPTPMEPNPTAASAPSSLAEKLRMQRKKLLNENE
jgi:putative transposase